MQIKKILVGIDFSHEADVALKQALDIGRHTKAEITLAHAYHTSNVGYLALSGQRVVDRLLAEVHGRSHARLQAECDKLENCGVEVSTVLLEGYPDHGIPAEAILRDVDLVVVGTHGRTGFQRLLLGSVAERIIRLCPTVMGDVPNWRKRAAESRAGAEASARTAGLVHVDAKDRTPTREQFFSTKVGNSGIY